MYIHLGNDFLILCKELIAILNIEQGLTPDAKEIIEVAELDKKLIDISREGKRKSMVICGDYVYLSPISSATLYKRAVNY